MRASRLHAGVPARFSNRTLFQKPLRSILDVLLRIRAVLIVVSAALLFPLTAVAQARANAASASSSGLLMLQVLLGLIVVLAAIIATAWLLRRLGVSQMRGNANMRVVGAVAVGPRERVILVEVRDTWLVLGVAPGRVNAVHQMPKPSDADTAAELAPPSADFKSRLKHFMQPRPARAK